jgi:hypothetical protein
MILGIPSGESYSGIHALADLSMCVLNIPTTAISDCCRLRSSTLWGVLVSSPWEITKGNSSGLCVACIILILCWLCGTQLQVRRVIHISTWATKWVNRHNEDYLADKQVNLGKKSLCHHLISRWLVFIGIHPCDCLTPLVIGSFLYTAI